MKWPDLFKPLDLDKHLEGLMVFAYTLVLCSMAAIIAVGMGYA